MDGQKVAPEWLPKVEAAVAQFPRAEDREAVYETILEKHGASAEAKARQLYLVLDRECLAGLSERLARVKPKTLEATTDETLKRPAGATESSKEQEQPSAASFRRSWVTAPKPEPLFISAEPQPSVAEPQKLAKRLRRYETFYN